MPARPNAAFYFAARNYQLAGDMVVGRQSATGGFLRGFVRHGGTDTICYYADNLTSHEEFVAFVKESGGDTKKIIPYLPISIEHLQDIGTLFRPGPGLGDLAWLRRHFDQRAFSLTGITHTVSEAMALDVIGDLLIAPVQSWDALVCTSRSVHAVVTRILDGWADYLEQRFSIRPPLIKMPIIPLGVDADRLAAQGGDTAVRSDLRTRMNIADDDIAILYAGRLDHVEKANPVPMLLATEIAQHSTKIKLHLVQAGQASSPEMESAFKQAATALAPSVTHHFIDGSMTELYDGAWAAADIFISLSDNIQESFGLTPVEAMAAGLPCVISDWNGYRETVRNGEEGLTVPTAAPPPGVGEELSYLYGAGYVGYPVFTGTASQSTAVDPAKAAEALSILIGDTTLRQSMGNAGRKRAAEFYDWRHVITAHQDLWLELARIRKAAKEITPRINNSVARPLRPDPFDIFNTHATTLFSGDTRVSANTALDSNALTLLRRSELATPLNAMLLNIDETAALLEHVIGKDSKTVEELAKNIGSERLTPFYLTIGWLAKIGFLKFSPGQNSTRKNKLPFSRSITWKNLIASQ